ncbi:MAG: hypothetical protein ACTSPI_00020 [Candidatus Heimdallarchaeaceae archaeon]
MDEDKLNVAIRVWTNKTLPPWFLNFIKDTKKMKWITYVPDNFSNLEFPWMAAGTPYAPKRLEQYRAVTGYLYVGY